VVALGAAVDFGIPERPEDIPARAVFVDFPDQIGQWVGRRESLQPSILDLLRLDDYLLVNYRDADGLPINFYVAYYQSQRNGFSIHSPRRCLPGGGWRILKSDRYLLHPDSGPAWPVNRVLIEQDNHRQLVYYWFQERGRYLTNEYVVRWYMFWDALTRNRTDGALVRLVVPVPKGVREENLDAKLAHFASATQPTLSHYLPD
jgi:EpsI family protein